MPRSLLEDSKIIYACTEGSRVRSTIVRKLKKVFWMIVPCPRTAKTAVFSYASSKVLNTSFPRNSLKGVILMPLYKLIMPTQQAAICTVCYVLSCHNVPYVLFYYFSST
uniref:Uncharacterized protein n=1 Tax=Ixodes ricinus TaxID=34613 RepID=A0A6B0UH75_IXORI